MSQITRCPSCGTTFKVVADQLRISEGWVRCGQCKEVFDASAHLLPLEPAALLPDVLQTAGKHPSVRVARESESVRSWGAVPQASRSSAVEMRVEVPSAPLISSPPLATPGATPPLVPQVGDRGTPSITAPVLAPMAASASAMEVPAPAVPAFLMASELEGLHSPPLHTPFGWRRQEGGPSAESADTSSVLSAAEAPFDTRREETAELPSHRRANDFSAPGGYELPFAELRDSQWPEELTEPAAIGRDAERVDAPPFPALDVLAPTSSVNDVDDTADATSQRGALALAPSAAELPAREVGPDAASSERLLTNSDFAQATTLAPAQSIEGLGLVEDHSAEVVLRAPPRKTKVVPEDHDDDDGADEEVSFVRSARRKAFWRKPTVRAALFLLLLVSTVSLALQIAVHERDRIVAMDLRARPWMVMLCELFQCEIGPQRQISDVVIDSSAFNKGRGDSYQLVLTLKNQSVIPLAMPAIELTLTDAQDQPVLRRILLPPDMGGPPELPARGDWTTSVSLIVTTGGARVAGYRVLAFYP